MQPNQKSMNSLDTQHNHDKSWVSKTDLIRFIRCPYGFYVLDKGLVDFEDTINEYQSTLIEQGVAFQSAIEAETKPLPEPIELDRLFSEQSVRLFSLPLLKNPELRIMGKPDAVDTHKGQLLPVEIKSHKDVQLSDELELAFYWMLLQPYRTKNTSPRGFLLLRRNGVVEQVEVPLRSAHFERVQQSIEQVRYARINGVRPRMCGCPICSGPMLDEIRRSTLANKDVSLIWGIGWQYARCLEEMGISTYEHLLETDTDSIVEGLRRYNYHLSANQVNGWKHHAKSFSIGRPVLFGEPFSHHDSFLALDLEYDPESTIWLIGICLMRSGKRTYYFLWADSPKQEKVILNELYETIQQNPSLPIVTWSGTSADIPQIRKATERHKLSGLLEILESNHLDLFQATLRSLRFPMASLSIDEVARFFGLPRLSSISSGLQAQMIYRRFCNSRDEAERIELKNSLIEYNRDDLAAVIGIKERLVELSH